jgi:hypothetical protein
VKNFACLRIAIAVVLFASAGISRAAPPDAAPDTPGPIAALPWLHEGTVFTYSKHAAYVPGKPVTWKQNDDGDWIDPATGKSYDKYINYGTSAPFIGQIKVVSLDGNSAALENSAYGLEQNLGFADPVLQSPGPPLVTDVSANSFWKLPSVLAGEASDASQGKLVTQISWPLGDQKIDAVRIQITTDDLYQLEIYDRKTGICVHAASAWVSGPDGDTEITRSDLIRLRQLAIPWAGEPIPQAVIKADAMHYVGEIKKGGAFANLPAQTVMMNFAVKNRGERWILFDTQAMVSGMLVATPTVVYGPGEFGGMWIGPKAAATFTAGQVLDEDPDTKMKTVVSKVTDKAVEITSSNLSSGRAYVYDLGSGIQAAWGEYDGPTQTTQTMRRQEAGK